MKHFGLLCLAAFFTLPSCRHLDGSSSSPAGVGSNSEVNAAPVTLPDYKAVEIIATLQRLKTVTRPGPVSGSELFEIEDLQCVSVKNSAGNWDPHCTFMDVISGDRNPVSADLYNSAHLLLGLGLVDIRGHDNADETKSTLEIRRITCDLYGKGDSPTHCDVYEK